MDETEIRSRAITFLSNREHTRAELAQKLARRVGKQQNLEGVLDELETEGLLSESRFVESFIRSRIERGQGPVKIRAELSRRGVDDDLIERFLTRTSEYWRARARSVRERRFGQEPPDGEEAWARQARFLSSRGFPADLIYAVLTQADD